MLTLQADCLFVACKILPVDTRVEQGTSHCRMLPAMDSVAYTLLGFDHSSLSPHVFWYEVVDNLGTYE